jgi:hypothetical protein
MKRNPLSGMNAMRGKLPVPEPSADGDESRGDGFGLLKATNASRLGANAQAGSSF